MGKTVRSWQKKAGWRENRHLGQKRKHFGKSRDRFRFDPRQEYKGGDT